MVVTLRTLRFAAALIVAVTAAGLPRDGLGAESLSLAFDPGPSAPSVGQAEAPVVVVEFFDFRCTFCAEQARTVYPEIARRYIDKGLVRYVFVEALSPDAVQSWRDAEAARCAGDSGRYTAARKYLFSADASPREGPLDLVAFATAVGADPASIGFCVSTHRHEQAIANAVARARAYRVSATPTYLVGFPVAGTGEITVQRNIVGATNVARIAEAIEQLLASERAKSSHRIDR